MPQPMTALKLVLLCVSLGAPVSVSVKWGYPWPHRSAMETSSVCLCSSSIVQGYLQLWHAANQLVRHLHLGTGGIVKRHQLRGQVLVPIEQPDAEREKPGKAESQEAEGI